MGRGRKKKGMPSAQSGEANPSRRSEEEEVAKKATHRTSERQEDQVQPRHLQILRRAGSGFIRLNEQLRRFVTVRCGFLFKSRCCPACLPHAPQRTLSCYCSPLLR